MLPFFYGPTAPRRNEQLTSQCFVLTPGAWPTSLMLPRCCCVVAPALLRGGRVLSEDGHATQLQDGNGEYEANNDEMGESLCL